MAALVGLLDQGILTGRLAKQVLEVMAIEGGQPAAIAKANGWEQLDDTDALKQIVAEVIAAHPDQVAKVAENPRMMGFFVGQVMKATGGKAPGKLVNQLLREALS